jgi:methionyl-tRNA formyltransferase
MLRPRRLREPEVVEQVLGAGPDLLVLADYGQIVPAALLTKPRHAALNLHPSLLPRHRGASPVQAAILEGDKETGVTIIQMDSGLDTGPVVAQARHATNGAETAPELEARLSLLGADLLARTLEPYLAGDITPQPQSAEGVTLTRPLRREDGRLDPVRGLVYLDRQIRAYLPWPGTFFETDAGRVIVWDARPLGGGATRETGTLLRLPANRVALAASDGLLELIEVQPAGGRRMSAVELVRGRPGLVGSVIR